jgi:hypothetical protein
VGAYQADLSGKSDAGKSYIVFGKQDTDVINLSAIVAGTGGFVNQIIYAITIHITCIGD